MVLRRVLAQFLRNHGCVSRGLRRYRPPKGAERIQNLVEVKFLRDSSRPSLGHCANRQNRMERNPCNERVGNGTLGHDWRFRPVVHEEGRRLRHRREEPPHLRSRQGVSPWGHKPSTTAVLVVSRTWRAGPVLAARDSRRAGGLVEHICLACDLWRAHRHTNCRYCYQGPQQDCRHHISMADRADARTHQQVDIRYGRSRFVRHAFPSHGVLLLDKSTLRPRAQETVRIYQSEPALPACWNEGELEAESCSDGKRNDVWNRIHDNGTGLEGIRLRTRNPLPRIFGSSCH